MFHPIRSIKRMVRLYDDLVYTGTVLNSTSEFVKYKHKTGCIEIDNLAMYSEGRVTFFYLIDGFPRYLNIHFKDRLRQSCRNSVTITFLSREKSHVIAWDSAEMRSRLRILGEQANELSERDVNAFNLHSNIGDLKKNQWTQESLEYLSDASSSRGRALLRASFLMMVSGEVGEEFDDSIASILADADQLGIRLTRVLYNIPQVLGYFAPTGNIISGSIDGRVPAYVLPDEILSRFSTYNQGTLGVDGVYFGTDIYPSFPVLKRVKGRSTDAENWLITAETGGGKSYFIKSILLQLLSLGYNGTIMDIEGFEYVTMNEYLGDEYSVVFVNMAEGTGGYYDPVEIALFDKSNDNENARSMSMNCTLNWFKVLVGKLYTEDQYTSIIINDAVAKAYMDRGVTANPETWHLSKGMSLFTIYDVIKELTQASRNEDYTFSGKRVVALLSKYFDRGGTRSDMFKKRIQVQDIMDADLVICSFGMAGKASTSVDETQMALMQLGAAQLSYQRSLCSKARGKYNFKLWEEFQRWGKFEGSEVTLGTALTGGRKLGDVNIIITNVLKELLEDDRFNIFSTVTSFMCGAVADSKVRQDFCNRLSIPMMLPELNKISTIRDEEEKEAEKGYQSDGSIYEHAFLCGLDKSKYSVVKMLLPEYLAESSLLKTGV